ncbi:MAG: SIS domain-containing protein [Alistipes sp.]|nr:SIS domain-containing protein [Alistipes senegalensis]MCM1249620.1 SIS domain-containing protein [Alistipes sp.]
MQQPNTWLSEYEKLQEQRETIKSFVSKHLDENYEIIFTGAGTSAYIGDVLEVATAETPFRGARSVATTDLITHPESYFSPEKKVLLISFARSGNSPESLGAVNLADRICGKNIAHIFITCNEEGRLAQIAADKENCLLVLLPPETDDKSLAMTSSFSTMLLTAMLIADIDRLEAQRPLIGNLTADAAATLRRYDEAIRRMADRDFKRAVFLGSGALKGIAEESHLKLQELTDGGVVCCFDSFLGFRHGPKAVVNGDTLLVYLLSDDPNVRRYETDLIRQIAANNRVVGMIAVSAEPVEVEGVEFDLNVVLDGGTQRHGIYGCIPYVFVAQLLGYYKSLAGGLDPDAPSVSGNISRVVEGVTIYPY